MGLILASGNPNGLNKLKDLTKAGVRFVNRQQGSGTRVWLDAQLQRAGIKPSKIIRYQNEKMTQYEVARSVNKGEADIGLGVETAALSFGLDFKFLTTERYDLVIPVQKWELDSVQALKARLETDQAKTAINNLGGYDTSKTGVVSWVN